jgi:iron complex outermembrane recepter protein
MKTRRLFAAASAAALAAGAAHAEETEAQERTPGDVILVTARRTEENIRDVPIPITSISGARIERTGAYNVNRLKELVPTLQFYSSNPRNSAINIRGLGSPFGLTNDGIEPGVGVYIDQVYYSRPAAATFDFVDIKQIEVLRGPQGVLYGKNTTAGAINITTRPPSFEPEGLAEISYGNYGFLQAKTSVSGPLIGDSVAGRLSFSGTRRDGLVENVVTGENLNDQNNLGVRGQILIAPTDRFKATLSGDFNRQDTKCCTQVFVGVAPTLRAPDRQYDAIAADFGYEPPSRDPFDRLSDVDTEIRGDQELGGASLVAEWKIGPGVLTSVSAWRFWDWNPSNDRDFIGLPVTTVSANPSKQRQWTQEVRYSGPLTDAIDVTAGVFAYRQTIDSNNNQEQGAAAARFLLAPAPGNTPELLDGLRSSGDVAFENNSFAAYGQATWRVTDRLRILPGLRLNYDSKDASFDSTVTGGLDTDDPVLIARQNSILAAQSYDADFEDFNVSGQVTASYALADAVNVFATYARSFKSGGVNLSGVPNDAEGNPSEEAASIDPEKVDHYEIGLKADAFARRLSINAAIFQTDIADYQANVVNASVGVLRGYLANAEKVRVRGAELEMTGNLTDELSLYASAAYTNGEYVSFPDAPCPLELTGGPQVCDVSGTRLPGISKWAASLGGEYALPASIGGAEGEAFLGVDASYRTSFSSSASQSDYLNVDGYALLNLRAGWRSSTGWDLYGWVRNATDAEYFDFLSAAPGNSGLIVGQTGDPRTYGITLRASF